MKEPIVIRRGLRATFVGLLTCVTLLASCAPGADQDVQQANTGGVSEKPSAPKTLRLGTIQEPTAGIALFGGSGVAGSQHTFTYHAGLTIYDAQSNVLPHLARKVPSLSDGDWTVAPDGHMDVAWKLRPNVKWHDGTPLTAGDFVLGLQIVLDPDVPLTRASWSKLIADVAAPDDETLVVSWKQPYQLANVSGPTDIAAVPRHIMGALYQSGDKTALTNSLYWTREFIGLGPYRMGEWELGSHTEAIAFDDYFLGRPKIDRVIVRYFAEANALMAGLLSGDIDMSPEGFKIQQVMTLRQAWDPTSAGTVIPSMYGIRHMQLQWRDPTAPWVRDQRVRQALMYALDRQTMVDELQFGLTTVADTYTNTDDPAHRLVEQRGLTRYPFDPARAQRLFADAGFTRGTDGVLQSSGQRLTMEVRWVGSSPDNLQEALVVADQWKVAGMVTSTLNVPDEAPNKDELKATFPNALIWPLRNTIDAMEGFVTPQISAEGNRFKGKNFGGYSNPTLDSLYEQYSGALEMERHVGLRADMLKLAADQIVFMPLYYTFGTSAAALRKGIRGPAVVPSIQAVTSWNIHTWEME